MKWLVGVARFWWDFVVGDDWRVALLVALAIGATAVLAHETHLTVWWLMPVAALLVLWLSLRRAIRS